MDNSLNQPQLSNLTTDREVCRSVLNRVYNACMYVYCNQVIQDWEDMCMLWDYTFGPRRMKIDPKETKILLTEPPMSSSMYKEILAEVTS